MLMMDGHILMRESKKKSGSRRKAGSETRTENGFHQRRKKNELSIN